MAIELERCQALVAEAFNHIQDLTVKNMALRGKVERFKTLIKHDEPQHDDKENITPKP